MRPAHPAHTIGPAASATLLSALSLADAKLAELRSRRPLSAPALRTLRVELRLQTTYDSNAIEGSKLTLQETVLVVQEGFALKGARLTDLNAAVGFARAWAMLLSPGEPDASAPPVTLTTLTTPITPHLIRSVHQLVMLGALPQHCGVYRNHDVRILGTACETAPFVDIPRRVDDLTRWVSSPEAQALHPIERTARFHLAFETIHRFADGNGRTGRLLLSLMLSQGGYWPVNIRVNEDRTRYYDAFAAWNAAGEAGPMTALIAERAAAQLEVVLEACELWDRHPV